VVDTPFINDGADESLRKTVSLLNKIEAKTGSTTITGPVTVSNEVEVTNSSGSPIPVSGSVSVSNLPATQPISGSVSVSNFPATQPVSGTFWQATQPVSIASAPVTPVTDNGGSLTVDGTVTANIGNTHDIIGGGYSDLFSLGDDGLLYVQANVTNFPATQPISGTVTAAQATASSLKTQAQVLNSAGSLITYAESGTYGSPSVDVISVQNPQGTSAAIATFTSTTASTSLVSAATARKTLTVYNSGPGDLNISPTATCTTTNFQIRLASNDYWECPDQQVTMAHTAVFSSAGTAYVTTIS